MPGVPGRSGARPKPTALKLLTGNPGKRAINQHEPKPEAALPPPPRHLSAAARAVWREVAKELLATGVVTRMDAHALAVYCDTYARWLDAKAKVDQFGAIVKAGNGALQQSPYELIRRHTSEHIVRLEAEFGMTPSSRSRVQVVRRNDGPMDIMDQLLAN